jgi:hypothetical protein
MGRLKLIRSLLAKTKANLILTHGEDDDLLKGMIESALAYAEGYQHRRVGWYASNPMPASTERGIIMLASHFYESRDGATAGFFSDNAQSAQQIWRAVQDLLRMDRDWGAAL